MKKILCGLYVAVILVMGAATLVEAAEGTPFAHRNWYGTWWFAALWGALTLCGIIYIIRCKAMWARKSRSVSTLALHASFVVILAGALLTHLTGRNGTIHLRMHEPQDVAEIEHNGEKYLHRLNFKMELTGFEIVEDEGGAVKDYRSEFTIGEEKGMVSMNNICKHGALRFYQMSYDYDRRGSTLMINRDPYGIPVTYCGYALLLFSFIGVVAQGRRQSRQYGIYIFALLLTAAWCVYYFVLDGSWSQIPVLRHPLLIFHVVIIIMAYALLLIQTVRSAWWLIKKHDVAAAPRLGGLRAALCFLSIGIFLGAIWANISWGNYWSWDSKETWALITLMIYAVPLHTRSLPVFGKPRVYHVYMLFAFLTVLMTYFGVNYLLTGLHSYN